jgi:hypothetical protein
MKMLVVLLLSLAAPVAFAAATQCTLGSLTRTVEVVYADPPSLVPCEVLYAKPDEGVARASVWSAQVESQYCEARAAEFVDKLRGMGWNCADASEPAAAPNPAAAAE